MHKNLYQILDVEIDATQEEIKKSYRLLASKFHPDKHNGDKFFEEKFKEINDAYETLIDPAKRKHYDHSFLGNQVSDQSENISSKSSTNNSTTNATNTHKEYSKSQSVNPKKKEVNIKRQKGCLIGIVSAMVFAITLSLGDGWWVPIGILGLIVTIRQAFVIFVTFLKD